MPGSRSAAMRGWAFGRWPGLGRRWNSRRQDRGGGQPAPQPRKFGVPVDAVPPAREPAPVLAADDAHLAPHRHLAKEGPERVAVQELRVSLVEAVLGRIAPVAVPPRLDPTPDGDARG